MRIEIKPEDLYDTVVEIVDRDINPSIAQQIGSIGMKAGNQLRNNTITQFNGGRSGKVYKVRKVRETKSGRTKVSYQEYRASAPGESPAIRTGNLKKSFLFRNTKRIGIGGNTTVTSEAYSDVRPPSGDQYNYAFIDEGMPSRNIAARPYSKKALEKTADQISTLIKRIQP